jgi:hypothetical protein
LENFEKEDCIMDPLSSNKTNGSDPVQISPNNVKNRLVLKPRTPPGGLLEPLTGYYRAKLAKTPPEQYVQLPNSTVPVAIAPVLPTVQYSPRRLPSIDKENKKRVPPVGDASTARTPQSAKKRQKQEEETDPIKFIGIHSRS